MRNGPENIPSYHEQARHEVAALVPSTARNIIDVGCGAGVLGEVLERREGVTVRGIEPFASAAARARSRLTDVHEGSFLDNLPASWPSPDCIIFADVLEHMVDPWEAVRRAKAMLAADGCIVASVPNVRHSTVLASVWNGRWDYADCGLLDRTHLRFFARANAIELFQQAGMTVEVVRRNVDEVPWTMTLAGRPIRRFLMGKVAARRWPGPLDLAADSLTLQFLVRARPA
jgi:O-antigen biosynthesis protein